MCTRCYAYRKKYVKLHLNNVTESGGSKVEYIIFKHCCCSCLVAVVIYFFLKNVLLGIGDQSPETAKIPGLNECLVLKLILDA